jgi:sugar O-acyltransferase (sialic acid O-acetyltransferase NeuD family)
MESISAKILSVGLIHVNDRQRVAKRLERYGIRRRRRCGVKTVIYGNGAMAKVLFSYARRSMDLAGFTVDDHCMVGVTGTYLGLPLIGFSRVEELFSPTSHNMIIAVGFLEMNELRVRKSHEARQKSYSLASYVHESVLLNDDVSIDENCVILDHVSIHPGSRIGQGTFISSNVNIGHDCTVGAYSWINSGVALAGGCKTGQGCFFGVNASATDGLRIGARNFIAAGTVVNRNTEDDQVYLSEPGQLFRLKSQAFLGFSRLAG